MCQFIFWYAVDWSILKGSVSGSLFSKTLAEEVTWAQDPVCEVFWEACHFFSLKKSRWLRRKKQYLSLGKVLQSKIIICFQRFVIQRMIKDFWQVWIRMRNFGWNTVWINMRRISRNEAFVLIDQMSIRKIFLGKNSVVSEDHLSSANQLYMKVSDSKMNELKMQIQKEYFERRIYSWDWEEVYSKIFWMSHDAHLFRSQIEKLNSNHQYVKQIQRVVENSFAQWKFVE